jgi:chromosome partitioning protein
VARTWEVVKRARDTYNPRLKLPRILITRVKHTNAANVVLDGIEGVYKDQVVPVIIFESTAVDEAEQLMQPVVVYSPNSPAAQGYLELAEILSHD